MTEFEDQLVTMCRRLTDVDWTTSNIGHMTSTTLLHLSASIGLCRLTCSLLHWAAECQGTKLCSEVDALALDTQGYTPLVKIFYNVSALFCIIMM